MLYVSFLFIIYIRGTKDIDNIKLLKAWFKFAKPSKKYMTIAYMTTMFTSIMYVIEPIFAAKVIAALTIADYKWAAIWLTFGILQVVLRNWAWHINFKNLHKLYNSMYYPIQNRIIDKILSAKDVNFKQHSKENMINIIGNDIVTITDFSNTLTCKVAELLRVIISVIIVFTYNVPIGCVLLVICIINYFILDKLNSKLASNNKDIAETRGKIFECFTDIVEGREITRDLDVAGEIKNKYYSRCEDFKNARNRHRTWTSYRDNWFFVFWSALVYAITCYLIFMLSSGSLTLTLYLIIVPYLTSILDKMNSFFNILSDLKNTNIAVMRLNTILNFTEKELIEFGNNATNDIDGEVAFNDVSFIPTADDDSSLTPIKHINFHIKSNSVTLFHGRTGSGKRMIFYILRRVIKPTSGVALIGNINIFDYQKGVYKENVAYVTSKSYFFDDTIINNLNMVEKNIDKIINVCKSLSIHDDIMALPQGYDTPINKHIDKISPEFQFLLGLARALLTDSEIVMIYETPTGLTSNEKNHIKQTLSKLKDTRTFLIFSASRDMESIADATYEIDDGVCKLKK